MIITSRKDIERVSAAARKLGGYQELINFARQRREQHKKAE